MCANVTSRHMNRQDSEHRTKGSGEDVLHQRSFSIPFLKYGPALSEEKAMWPVENRDREGIVTSSVGFHSANTKIYG